MATSLVAWNVMNFVDLNALSSVSSPQLLLFVMPTCMISFFSVEGAALVVQ